ncbi:hypothetical protein [Methylorubrum extorquens]|uniref:Uncharacterized protein n=1 Tax=Methylorubrum extorquens TaxID=408 RepID=A0AAX3WDV6_METEX|nr:hypothetical protein [Methylorubrum extorquens]WHQ69487.1 hypothetical protein KEC54_24630 [Methylorubrum extorquens]
MKPQAIEKAKNRLRSAESAVSAMFGAKTGQELSDAWTNFLVHSQAIYSILETGSGKQGRSAGWFGRKKHERRTDPLLRYLHHARNSEEHGISEGSIALHFNPSVVHDHEKAKNIETIMLLEDSLSPQGVSMAFRLKDGSIYEPAQKYYAPILALHTVVDTQFNDSFDPPSEHLGRPLENGTGHGVAVAGLAYMQALLLEAENLSADSIAT